MGFMVCDWPIQKKTNPFGVAFILSQISRMSCQSSAVLHSSVAFSTNWNFAMKHFIKCPVKGSIINGFLSTNHKN